MVRHFLTLSDLQASEIRSLIDRAIELKSMWHQHLSSPQLMHNRTIALVFEKSSTRTRISFETAAHQLGGNSIFLAPGDTQLNRGESVADTARVLSSMVSLIVTRTGAHNTAESYARNSSVPVINGLSDAYHPCQLLADLQTIQEIRGEIDGCSVAWVGDGNNMCVTWAIAASLLKIELHIFTPEEYAPDPELIKDCDFSRIQICQSPIEAVKGVDVVVTDTWLSMGQEDDRKEKLAAFESVQVTSSLMDSAADDVIFLHCLPAYRGLEVQDEVIDGPQSAVWQEAENRLHAQKALIELLLSA
ncbi:MAG: ornithine carbamoyltransferase [Acidiferrobacterales bacterium]|nr:ornithine carbamoyltransferase [Acidiferrobacterales bacterium]